MKNDKYEPRLFVGGPYDGMWFQIPHGEMKYFVQAVNKGQKSFLGPVGAGKEDYDSSQEVTHHTIAYRAYHLADGEGPLRIVMTLEELEGSIIDRLIRHYKPNCPGACDTTSYSKMAGSIRQLAKVLQVPCLYLLEQIKTLMSPSDFEAIENEFHKKDQYS